MVICRKKGKKPNEEFFFNASSNKSTNQALPPIPNAVPKVLVIHHHIIIPTPTTQNHGYSGEYAFPDDTNKNSVISNDKIIMMFHKIIRMAVLHEIIHMILTLKAPPSFVPGKRGKAEDDVGNVALLWIMRSNFFINFQMKI